MTDAERVSTYFRNSEGRIVNHREIIEGLRISEYSGRIVDVRRDWGCTCGQNKNTCDAIEHIVNVKRGYYRYLNHKIHYAPMIRRCEPVLENLPERTMPLSGEVLNKWEATRQMLQRRSNV